MSTFLAHRRSGKNEEINSKLAQYLSMNRIIEPPCRLPVKFRHLYYSEAASLLRQYNNIPNFVAPQMPSPKKSADEIEMARCVELVLRYAAFQDLISAGWIFCDRSKLYVVKNTAQDVIGSLTAGVVG
jgi:hypothetical protein